MTRERIFRWLLWFAGVVLALVLITIAFAIGLLRASLPKLDGELRMAGVRSSLVIERDDLGVPTITASNRLGVISQLIEEADCIGDEGAGNRQWLKDQEALLGISNNSKRIIAKTKGHNIQFNEPDLIVDTIRETVVSARTRVKPIEPERRESF